MRFIKNPVEFEAVQWRGDNLEEMQAFCGTRTVGSVDEDKFEIPIFALIGTSLVAENHVDATAELWVEANKQTLGLVTGEWVIKDELGFYPCADKVMAKNNTPLEDRWGSPPTFAQELVWLINKHSLENGSNTPDWILGEYLMASLKAWDLGVRLRSDYLDEPKEFKIQIDTSDRAVDGALDGNDGKIVPLVDYSDGRRNVIGTAKISVTPGEVLFTGTLGSIESVVPLLGLIPTDGQFSIDDADPLGKGR